MNRELDIQNFLDNVRTKFDDCTAINYTFLLYDRKMELKNQFNGSSTTANKKEKADAVIASLESYLQRHPEIAKVDAEYGGVKKHTRTKTNYIFRSNDDETTEELRSQLDAANTELSRLRSESNDKYANLERRMDDIKNNEKVDIQNTDYTSMMGNTIQILAGLAGVPNDCVDERGQISHFGIGRIMESRIKEDIEKNERITKIQMLTAENEQLKAQIEEMRKEYQRMEDELEELEEYQRETEPLLEELQTLRTKSGLISAGLGNVMVNVIGSVMQKTNLGALLGIEEQQPAQQMPVQPQSQARVQAVEDED